MIDKVNRSEFFRTFTPHSVQSAWGDEGEWIESARCSTREKAEMVKTVFEAQWPQHLWRMVWVSGE